MDILAFEANSTLSRENETKIVKITYVVEMCVRRDHMKFFNEMVTSL